MSSTSDPHLSLPELAIQGVIVAALAEDMPWGDLTTDALIPPTQFGSARLEAKEEGVVAGLPVAAAVFHAVDPSLSWQPALEDGAAILPREVLGTIRGSVSSILKAERVALNFLQRLSGIATATSRYVGAVSGTSARIVDTRKTAPGLRLLEKYAVRVGGGFNHRFCLSDGVLVKDNHLAALRASRVDLKRALIRARHKVPHTVKIEVEVDSLGQIEGALSAGADIVLLDNMTPDQLLEAVQMIDGRALTEASGGINLDTVRAVAESGVDLISVGALTHSVRALDISLDLDA